MNSTLSLIALAALAVVFLILNFTVEDAGTIFLILAVATALLAGYLASTRRTGATAADRGPRRWATALAATLPASRQPPGVRAVEVRAGVRLLRAGQACRYS